MILEKIDQPSQLRDLAESELPALADEVRQHLMNELNKCGGHFAGNLGTVELAIALHYVFNTPDDRLIWDVGHQAYPHKILTGRRDQISTIRQTTGLSPFPKRAESEYDAFGVGHSSTSISAAIGMAVAESMREDDRDKRKKMVAIIGDGAMTAGMAFEALNHAGDIDVDVLIILNDNEMSISPNVGALSSYLTKLLSGKTYTSMREGSKKVLDMMPPVKSLAKSAETGMKTLFSPVKVFTELGVDYYGPIDGHDVDLLVQTLGNLKDIKGPRLLHLITKKGKGYEPAENDPVKYHAVKPGYLDQDKKTTVTAKKAPTYSQVFGQWLVDIAEQDKRVVGITPAMSEGSGMVEFSKRFPKQYHDVAIAEQHSVTFAAGLACEGQKPVVAIYSTFLQRAYDQLIHDVAIQNLDVLFALDRAGIVGGDGTTHNGSFDLSYLRCIPNMIVMAPSDENECRQMLYTGYVHKGPAAVRYPRGQGVGAEIQNEMQAMEIGKGIVRREGKNVAILAFGGMLHPAMQAAGELNATVANMRFVKPLDTKLIDKLAKTHDLLVTIEENAIMGGAGSGVNEYVVQQGLKNKIINLGLPDQFIEHGDTKELLAECGLDKAGILASINAARS